MQTLNSCCVYAENMTSQSTCNKRNVIWLDMWMVSDALCNVCFASKPKSRWSFR